MPSDRCPVCLSVLSVTLVYCGQTAGLIKISLGTDLGLGPGYTVLEGDPAPPTERGASSPPTFRPTLLWDGRPSQQLLSSCKWCFVTYGHCYVSQFLCICPFSCRPLKVRITYWISFLVGCQMPVPMHLIISVLMYDFTYLQNIHGISSSVGSIKIWGYFCFCRITVHHRLHLN